MTLALLFYIVAFICFVLAAIGWSATRINLIAAGLALWLLPTILAGLHLG